MKGFRLYLIFLFLFVSCQKDPNDSLPSQKEIQSARILSDGIWTRLPDFSGRTHAVGFSIGNKGYIGTGFFSEPLSDFWEFDLATGSWEQKAAFGGGKRSDAAAFSIGGKGYIFGGHTEQGANVVLNDLWEFNPETNVWKRKADLPGSPRSNAAGLNVDKYGYIGLGITYFKAIVNNCPVDSFKILNDFWQYDPTTDNWHQKASFKGGPRYNAVAFSIGKKGYMGTGESLGERKADFWEYDPDANSWYRKADYLGGPVTEAVGFSIHDLQRGYLGTGTGPPLPQGTKFFEFNPVANGWIQRASLPSGLRDGVGFAIGNKGYIGSGFLSNATREFWEFNSLF